jgi:AraC-like DNA-binding protein
MGDTAPFTFEPGIDNKVIPTYLFNVVGAVLEERQVDPQVMVAGTDLSLEALYDQQTRVSFREAIQILSNAVDHSPTPALGLLVASRECFSDWGMLGYAIASCRYPEDAIDFSNRFYAATTNLAPMHSREEDGTYVTYVTPTFPVGRILPFLIEETFGGILNVFRALMAPSTGKLIAPKEVQFSYARPSYEHKYVEFFQCPVSFNCGVNKMIWRAEDARRPFNNHNPTTAKLAVKLCEQWLSETTSEPGLVYNIRCRLLRSPGNFPSPGALATELNTSERSLSRALRKLGTSYQEILDRVREKIATEYLTTSDLRLDDIAALTGFSDAGNFHRAFRKWTGKPPSAFRAKAKGQSPTAAG